MSCQELRHNQCRNSFSSVSISPLHPASISLHALSKSRVYHGSETDAPGRPALYRTNENFLRLFGLTSIDELPPIEVFGVPDTTEAIAGEADKDTPDAAHTSAMDDIGDTQ